MTVSWVLKLVSFIFWGWLYLCSSIKNPDKSPEYWSRQITLLHGSVSAVVGLYQCGWPTIEKCSFKSEIGLCHYALMLWSWGYFAFDLLWCFLYWPKHYVMLCHHASALGAINIYMGKEYSGCTFPCTIAFMEITNPFLQSRWFLRDKGYGKTMIFYVIEVLYLVLFIGLRGVIGTYLIYRILRSEAFETEAKLISVVFYFVSMALIYEILGYILYKYKNKIFYETDLWNRSRWTSMGQDYVKQCMMDKVGNLLDELGVILNDHA